MTNKVPTLLVAVTDYAAVVRVNGRANFTTSVSFKQLVTELRQRGFHSFVLDLSECVTMDSTFLGVLAGTALKLAEKDCFAACNGARVEPPHLRLLNPNQRVADLLENLGVSDLFQTVRCEGPLAAEQNLTPAQEAQPSREEVSLACLEAHRVLMEINPANIPRFKDVTQFLAEDLKKLRAQSEDQKVPQPG
jgi:anti-anti-sigma factor